MLVLERAKRKAARSRCRYKIAAIGFDKRGKLLGVAINYPRFVKFGGSVHAEMNLLHRYGKRLKSLLILRTNRSLDLLPISVCKRCQKILDRMEIEYASIRCPK